jgi:hypothetical protein
MTCMHGSYNEHLSTHAVALLLAFARRFEHYLLQKRWQRGPGMIVIRSRRRRSNPERTSTERPEIAALRSQ